MANSISELYEQPGGPDHPGVLELELMLIMAGHRDGYIDEAGILRKLLPRIIPLVGEALARLAVLGFVGSNAQR